MGPFNFPLIKNLPPYVFAIVNEFKMAAKNAGADIIDLGMGNPDLPTPKHIVDKLVEEAQCENNHRYSASRGIDELRLAIANWYKRKYDVEIDPETEAIVTIGAKEGLSHLVLATICPGEAVLVPDPTYPIHAYSVIIAGGKLISVPIGLERDFFEDLQVAVKNSSIKPKMLIISYPHNPTGLVAELDFFEKIVAYCKEHEILLVHDLAYADLCFDGHIAPSILQVKGAKDIAVELFSLSKSYSMAGWRVGFVCGNKQMIAALTRIKSYLDYGNFQAIQLASTDALNQCQDCVGEIRDVYKERRNALVSGLNKAGWEVPNPKGAMFIWARIPEKYKHLNSLEFAKFLIKEASVAVSPGIGFGEGGEGYIRFALVEDVERINKAVESIKKIL